jgi:hypothetical protein
MRIDTRLRWSMTDGAELLCGHCGDWWAVGAEHWIPGNWTRCRACLRDASALYQAMRRLDPAFRVSEVGRKRRYRQAIMREHPEYLRAYDRENAARARQRQRERRAA